MTPDNPAILSEAERFNWLRLLRCDNIGPRTFHALVARYGSAGAALEALPGLIASGKAGRPIRIAAMDDIELELEALRKCGAVLIGLDEPDYPPLLRRTDAAPPLIAVRGNLESLRRSKVAVVGSRNASVAGLAFTGLVCRGIARGGHVIVSGLARGVDARAHQSAIETGTIAVLAGGLGRVYPAIHEELLELIYERGAAISEMPFNWEARGRDFPRRNRIVAGLSRAVVVVEAARRSGSLITAKFAADYGREIFAVPGSPLDPRAEGPNDLLQDGASFCRKAEDVLDALAGQNLSPDSPGSGFFESGGPDDTYEPLWDELEFTGLDANPKGGLFNDAHVTNAHVENLPDEIAEGPPAEPEEIGAPGPRSRSELLACVTSLLGPTPICVDELVRASEAPARDVRAILLELELAGRLERHGGDLVSLI
ncbi:DNA-processing protein DprA [Methylocapsa palsarum]|uniref:DNA processing protein n=1 Tax=Methylocapsa palsarum TaxID=1612308 RepID=A0A1I4AJ45_9HYPH|nr:DNA-processing protein DprA [Methylocapsa palsarum]SFK56200.1 DNA processing protein [Methylocapsa palsarum]